jgi:hypothetical protein
MAYLAENKVIVVKEAANLTHLVQMSDHALLHGQLQQQRRKLFEDIPSIAKNPELHLRELEQLTQSVFTALNITKAAMSLGFIYSSDRAFIGLTHESMEFFLDKLERLGKLRVEVAPGLRQDTFLSARILVERGILPAGTSRLITDTEIRATRAALCTQRARQRARNVAVDDEKKGTIILNGDELMAKRKAQIDAEQARAMAARTAKEKKKAALKAKDERAKALRDAMPDVSAPAWQGYERGLAGYYSGKKELEWAVKWVEKKLKKG